jgi:hypothetical protein
MSYWIAAQLVLILHLGFVCFVVLGGFLVRRWWWMLFVHIPAALWGALIEFQGWICPLTPLEHWFLEAAGKAGYAGGFIDHYFLPVLYPSALTRDIQLLLGIFVIVINLVAYGWLLVRHRTR